MAIAAWIMALQVAPIQSQQKPVPKGSIEGIVVRVGTAEPIAGARVALNRSDSRTTPTVITDAGGRFAFAELDAGAYRIEVAGKGYVTQEYGQRTFNGHGTPVHLTAGQTLKDITVHLTPAATIEGRISDSSGNPAEGVAVELLRTGYKEDGEKILHESTSAKTNHRGEYLLYWVTPGRYYLIAGSLKGSAAAGGAIGPNRIQEDYESAYYPGVLDVSQATVIELRAGDQVNAIDWTVGREQSYRIRGRVIDGGTGRGSPAASISMTYLSPADLGTTMYVDTEESYDPATGSFEIRNVPPGSYLVTVTVSVSERAVDSASKPITRESSSHVPVLVAGADVENVTLTVTPAVTLQGRLRIEGQELSAAPSLAALRVALDASVDGTVLPNASISRPPFQWTNSDGAFALANVSPAEYRVKVTGLADDYYVKAARYGQSDVLNDPMHFSGAPSPLDVVLSPNGGRIDGSVVNDKQELISDTEVVLIPDRQRNRIDLYRTASTDETGHFVIRGIPPGDYKVFAWEALEDFAYYDPELVRLFEQRGKPVRIVESSKESVEVKIIPAGQ